MNASQRTTPAQERQFSLQSMFILLTGLSLWLAVLASVGLDRAILVMLPMLAIPVLEMLWFGLDARFAFGYAVVGLFLPLLYFPHSTWDTPRHPNPSGHCRNNLLSISCALMNYQDIHGTFPPLVTLDDRGQPMHSWRANLLPFLERADLAKAYDWHEPWNGSRNRKLHATNMKVLGCPTDKRRQPHETSYLAIATTDGTPAQRFAVIEIHGSGIHFLEPRDITQEEVDRGQSADNRLRLRVVHGDGYLNVLWPDGSMERLHPKQLCEKLAEKLRPPPEESLPAAH